MNGTACPAKLEAVLTCLNHKMYHFQVHSSTIPIPQPILRQSWFVSVRSILSRVICALLLPTGVFGQMAFVQATAQNSPSTLDNDPGAGNLLAVCVVATSGRTTTTSITDPAGDSFVAATGRTVYNNTSVQIWYAANIVGGAGSKVITINSTGFVRAKIHEYSGAALNFPLDGAKWTPPGTTSGSPNSLGAQTTVQDNDMIFSCESANVQTFSPDNGATQRTAKFANETSDDILVGAAGSYTVGWTSTGRSSWEGQAVAFSSVDGSPPPTCSSLVSPQTLNFTADTKGAAGYFGTHGFAQPYTVHLLQPGATNNWSITRFTSNGIVDTDVNGATSGANVSGPVDFMMYPYVGDTNGSSAKLPATGYSDSDDLTINGITCTISYTYDILPGWSTVYTNNVGIEDSSLPSTSKSGGQWTNWVQANDLVDPAAYGSLPGGTNLTPAPGATITLPVPFNFSMTTCTPPGYNTVYSSVVALNSDNTALYTISAGGVPTLFKFPCDGVPHSIALSPRNNGQSIMWDTSGLHPDTFYYFSTNEVRKVLVNLSTLTILSNASSGYAFAGAVNITAGDTDAMTEDGWVSFSTDRDHSGSTAHPNACLLDIGGGFVEHCIDISIDYPDILVDGPPNFTLGSRGWSASTNKRYLITNSQDGVNPHVHGPRYSLTSGATDLMFEGFLGLRPDVLGINSFLSAAYTDGTCLPAAMTGNIDRCVPADSHSDMGSDGLGHLYWLTADAGTLQTFRRGIGIIDLDAPTSMETMATQNGGGYSVALQFAANSDAGLSCQHNWCIANNMTGALGHDWDVISFEITSCTNGGNTCTLASAPGSALQSNDPAVVSAVFGCTQANGVFASNQITVTGTTLTLPGVTCGSAGTGGHVYKNVYPAATSFNHELDAIRLMNGGGVEVRRIGNTLGLLGSSVPNSVNYYQHGQWSLSMDDQWACGNTNFGMLGSTQVVCIPTGLPLPQSVSAGVGDARKGGVVK